MDKKTVIHAMTRIEALLFEANRKAEYLHGFLASIGQHISATGDIQHSINNARSIAAATKLLLEDEKEVTKT